MDAIDQLNNLLETAPYEVFLEFNPCFMLINLNLQPLQVSTATLLEAYVTSQLAQKTYDFSAIKALLKYYQLYYDPTKIDFVCNSLVLTLMRLPSTDFLSVSYLIPTSIVSDSKIQLIKKCANLLERGKFLEFWEEYTKPSTPETLFSHAAGFVESIRGFILGSLSETFKNIPKTDFQQHLGLNENSIVVFCTTNSYIEKIEGDYVVFVGNDENRRKKKLFDEDLRMDEGLRLVEFLRASKQE
jgi:hypothetical protein